MCGLSRALAPSIASLAPLIRRRSTVSSCDGYPESLLMSKVDKLKEEIGWLKVVFAILVAIDISLVGWLAQNYDDAPIFLQIVCAVAAVVITGGVVWVNRVAYRKIDELEEL